MLDNIVAILPIPIIAFNIVRFIEEMKKRNLVYQWVNLTSLIAWIFIISKWGI